MIETFRDRTLQRFFETGETKRLSVQNTKRLGRILLALDIASRAEDMNLPGLKFHSLGGDQKGRFSVWVSGNWRVTFGWSGENAIGVDLEDYH